MEGQFHLPTSNSVGLLVLSGKALKELEVPCPIPLPATCSQTLTPLFQAGGLAMRALGVGVTSHLGTVTPVGLA